MGFKSNKRNVMQALQHAESRALTAVGEYSQGLGISNAPVRTGDLRDSHGYQVNKHSVIVGNNSDHAVYVHEGTSKQRSQPFLRVPITQNASNIKRLVGESMRID
jgi:HK97 gp10 family phage protein